MTHREGELEAVPVKVIQRDLDIGERLEQWRGRGQRHAAPHPEHEADAEQAGQHGVTGPPPE